MWDSRKDANRPASPAVNRSPARTHSQNGNPQKINPESVKYFQPQNTTINSPRNHHNPPHTYHQKPRLKHPVSPRNPAKTPKTVPRKKLLGQAASVSGTFGAWTERQRKSHRVTLPETSRATRPRNGPEISPGDPILKSSLGEVRRRYLCGTGWCGVRRSVGPRPPSRSRPASSEPC